MADNKKVATANEKEVKEAVVAKTVTPEKTKKADNVIDKTAVKKEEAVEEKKTAATKKATTTKKTTAAKKPATKKATAEKTAEKKTTTRTSSKAKLANIYVQYDNREAEQTDLLRRIIENWVSETGKKETAIKTFDVYIKPEDNAAYYVINGQGSSITLF